MTAIPLVNLKRQYAGLKSDIDTAIAGVVARQEFINGSAVQAFTKSWLAALSASHGAACANGTVALSLALKALGIERGDEVITTAHTFIATAEAICAVGAVPVLADISRDNYALDVKTAKITPRTRAVIPVHIYGTAADMDAVAALAQKHDLKVIEDAAQAHLATWSNRALGTIGDAGTFSFYPGKNLGAYGDAGFAVAREAGVAATIAKLADHGRQTKYTHDLLGENNRMAEIQAAVLSAKLPHLRKWTEARRRRARQYNSRLTPAGFKVIKPLSKAGSVYHLYVVEVSNRDAALAKLKEAGIGAGVHYPVPLHLQPALAHLGVRKGQLPQIEAAAECILSLPICGDITEAEVDRVCDVFLRIARP